MEAGVTAQGGTLFVVSTPIGNMGDFSFRAVETLRSVAAVLAEDTRHTRHLMDRYEIATPLVAYHEHNEAKSTPGLVARLLAGESLALVSDAGTPLLSDPGARLVHAAIEAGVSVSPVPGASALLAALVASGLSVDRFTFFGFLARKGSERRTAIDEVVRMPHAVVLYEAANRVADTLAELARAGAGARATVVARELTKQYEELRRGTVAALAAYYESTPPRGEVVIVIAGESPVEVSEDELRARALVLRAEGRSARDVAAALTAELGAPRNLAYRLAHE
ncbi:MAG TPA: 16S rRNA (cytidine(1402)-2'-O)-methyltransferase [Gemmatimonadaceae bacterium]|nr:16S rRNA (cytidine(1402)-2'-O)-methyltransferase [Gemmatimonadaceae bacterium]